MKKMFISLGLTLALSIPASAQLSFGQAEKINDGWSFSLNDKQAQTVDLP
ncbi:MAG: hypothetical protein EZS26_002715, partial [Candidatus Ordinivivax streblomastigis]